jgi:F-type H+-transporting ATPase subunit gamma
MKMVAAAKLRRAQEAVLATRPYGRGLMELILKIVEREESEIFEKFYHPLFEERDPTISIEVIVLASDKGLCGSFNGNVTRKGTEFVLVKSSEGKNIKVCPVGRKVREYFSKTNLESIGDYKDIWQQFSFSKAKQFTRDVINRFLDHQSDEVYVVYNEFKSAISQNLKIERLLPISSKSLKEALKKVAMESPEKKIEDEEMVRTYLDYIYEPSKEQVLDSLVPLYLDYKVYWMFLESMASEHGARMSAMDNATNNATDMIHSLTLSYNRVRQASITKELLEVVAGAEALKR